MHAFVLEGCATLLGRARDDARAAAETVAACERIAPLLLKLFMAALDDDPVDDDDEAAAAAAGKKGGAKAKAPKGRGGGAKASIPVMATACLLECLQLAVALRSRRRGARAGAAIGALACRCFDEAQGARPEAEAPRGADAPAHAIKKFLMLLRKVLSDYEPDPKATENVVGVLGLLVRVAPTAPGAPHRKLVSQICTENAVGSPALAKAIVALFLSVHGGASALDLGHLQQVTCAVRAALGGHAEADESSRRTRRRGGSRSSSCRAPRPTRRRRASSPRASRT